jgi:hypothetical protein
MMWDLANEPRCKGSIPNGKYPASSTCNSDTLAEKVSNSALLQVTVAPDPNAAIVLYSFEFGVDGWAYPPWQANGGTTSQTTAFATDGSHGLQIQALNGGWVGLNTPRPSMCPAKPI